MSGNRACMICKTKGTGLFGIRAPGFWSKLSADRQKTLWHCAAPDCAAQALARRDRAFHLSTAPRPTPVAKAPPVPSSGGQTDLFGGCPLVPR